MRERGGTRCDAGFTLIEVLLATALFVFVAFAGFEAVRALAAHVTLLAQRAQSASQLAVAVAALRSDALSSVAVWKPASNCGDAIAFMQREAGGATSFLVYVTRPSGTPATLTLVRAAGAGALNPCDASLSFGTVIAPVAGLHVSETSAGALPAHVDPVSGNADGGIFAAAGLSSIAVDAHGRDYDGTPILTGNAIAEVAIDADPVETTLDLVAGNRPSGFTSVLTYACGARCQGTALFPETRGTGLTACTIRYDLPDSPAFYAPAAGQPIYVPAGAGRLQPVIASYAVNVGVIFTFAGPNGASAREELYVSSDAWSLPGMQDVPAVAANGFTLADYVTNSVKRAGAAKIFADVNGANTLAPQLALCAGMNAEANDFHP